MSPYYIKVWLHSSGLQSQSLDALVSEVCLWPRLNCRYLSVKRSFFKATRVSRYGSAYSDQERGIAHGIWLDPGQKTVNT